MTSLKKNVFYQSIYQLLITLVPLIVAPYISRVLGAENIGIHSYTFSITSYFVIFAMLGIGIHGNRAIAFVRDNKEKLNKTFSELFFLHLGISLFVLVSYVLFMLFLAGEYKFYFFIQSLIVLSALLDITWLFAGLEQFKLTVIRSAAIRIISTICIFLFVKNSDDLWVYVLIMALNMFAAQLALWFSLKKFVLFTKTSWFDIKAHIKPMIVLFIAIIAHTVYSTIGKVMLGSMHDKSLLGLYENSERIILIISGFAFSFNYVMIPRMSNITANNDTNEIKRLMLLSAKYVMIFALAFTFGIAAIARDFAPLFFGHEFTYSGVLMMGLCASIPFMCFQNIISAQYVIPNLKDIPFALACIAGAVVCVTANIALISHFQAIGVVIARVLAEITVCLGMVFTACKSLQILRYIRNSLFFFFTGLAMFFLVQSIGRLMEQSIVSVLIQICVGGVFYLGVSAIYLYKTKDEFFINNSKRIINIIKRNK
jgi:O-antigen/teichoic acid export membrane protein